MFHRASHWLFWTRSGTKSRLNTNRRACTHVSDLAGMYFMSCAALIAIDFRWGSTLWNQVFDLRAEKKGEKGQSKEGEGDRCGGQGRRRENQKQRRPRKDKMKKTKTRANIKNGGRACSAASSRECHVYALAAVTHRASLRLALSHLRNLRKMYSQRAVHNPMCEWFSSLLPRSQAGAMGYLIQHSAFPQRDSGALGYPCGARAGSERARHFSLNWRVCLTHTRTHTHPHPHTHGSVHDQGLAIQHQ